MALGKYNDTGRRHLLNRCAVTSHTVLDARSTTSTYGWPPEVVTAERVAASRGTRRTDARTVDVHVEGTGEVAGASGMTESSNFAHFAGDHEDDAHEEDEEEVEDVDVDVE